MRISRRTSTFYLAILGLLVATAGCTRATSDISNTQIVLPQALETHSLNQTMSSTPTDNQLLSHVVINVTGTGMTPIFYTWDSCSGCSVSIPAPATFNLDIPQGSRLIQVVAVYKNATTNALSIYYGDVTQTLSSASESAVVTVSSIASGTVLSGRVMGRYLTATSPDVGPTGSVSVLFDPGNGKQKMLVDEGKIINGWFQLMVLSGISLTYQVNETGLILWGAPVSMESTVFNPASALSYVVRAEEPVSIRAQTNSGAPSYSQNNASIYVWGYFGPAATGKNVCVTAATLQNLKTYTSSFTSSTYSGPGALSVSYPVAPGSLPATSDLTDLTPTVTAVSISGGVATGTTPCNGGYASQLYSNFLPVSSALIDGNGNDKASGFQVPFIPYSANNLINTTFSAGVAQMSGSLLPGTPTVMDSISIFKRVGSDNFRLDRPNCIDLAAGAYGYVPAGTSSAIAPTDTIFSAVTGITQSDATTGVTAVLCPSFQGKLYRQGIFLDSYVFSNGVSALANALIARDATGGIGHSGSLISGVCEAVLVHRQNSVPADITNEPPMPLTVTSNNSYVSLYTDANCTNGGTTTLNESFAANQGVVAVYIKESALNIAGSSDTVTLNLSVNNGQATSSTNLSIYKPVLMVTASSIDSSSCAATNVYATRNIEGDHISPSVVSFTSSDTWTNANSSSIQAFSTAGYCTAGTPTLTSGIYTDGMIFYLKNVSGAPGSTSLTFTPSAANQSIFGASAAININLVYP